MSIIGTVLVMGSGFVASAGTGALAKAVFTKMLTEEESRNTMIRIGMYAVAAAGGAAVGKYFVESTGAIVESVENGIGSIKQMIKDKKESKEEKSEESEQNSDFSFFFERRK